MDLIKWKRIIYRFSRKMPLKTKTCFFLSDVRAQIGGNYAPLKTELEARGYRIVEDFKASKQNQDTVFISIRRSYYLARAKYVFLEDFYSETANMELRENQKLIQLWHAAGAFKKFAWSRAKGKEIIHIQPGYEKYTDAIVSSEQIRDIYAEAFHIPIERVKATGIPRTDIFFDRKYMQSLAKELKQKYPQISGKKVILFAPTYRGIQLHEAGYDASKFNPKFLHEVLGDGYIILIKWHPAAENVFSNKGIHPYTDEEKNGYLVDVSKERDINVLLEIADILITDYSSIIFEYALLNKPIVYYWYDVKDYQESRGIYYPLTDYVYGVVAYNEDELIDAIQKAKTDEKARKKFLARFMSACDGNATKRVADMLEE